MAIVRDGNQRSVIADEKVLQPQNRVEIKVVRRLVQQQRLRLAKQRLAQQHPNLLAALQLRHLTIVQLVCDVEALQQNRRIRLGLVAVLLADDAFQLA